ncbi:SPFH domain-containing protein [Candidatus Cyanaurora vandensis]|uniref:SPFH domain-containing protein n=1 Tax=Candidatus Cyanaurora vandensis TaxID=2714958 RepID=UPI00257C6500|nr:SPFH domain-containing protein [Candidatus Cyanaurora vandensis]
MDTQLDNLKPLLRWAIPVSLVAVALLVGRSFAYVTEPGTATVVFNSFTGLQVGRVEQPGVSFVAPGADQPITYNVRTKLWQFSEGENIPNQAGTAIAINTADGQAFTVDVFLALRPNDRVLDTLHAQIGERYMETVVVPLVRSKIRDISAGFASQDFYQKERRFEIEQKALQLISRDLPATKVDDQTVPLILIEGVFLGTPKFPPALKDSLEQKQVASITAQTAGVKAQIQNKETERLLILARADQTAIELQGKAAARNAQLADLILYEKLEDRIDKAREQGQASPLKVIRVEGGSTVFLNVDPQKAAAVTAPPAP